LLASLTLTPARSVAAPVSFGFSGVINSVTSPGGGLPAGLAVDQPFLVIVTYDPDLLPAAFESPANVTDANYYTTNLAAYGYWARFGSLEISLPNPAPVKVTHSIEVRNGFGGWDGVQQESYGADAWFNQAPLPAGQTATRGFSIMDDTMTAFDSESLPLTLPPISQFQRIHRASFAVFQINSETGVPSTLYQAGGLISEITNSPRPPLSLSRQPSGSLRLSWPRILPGYVLQSANDLDGSPWTPVAATQTETPTEFVVEVKSAPAGTFFRLQKN